MDRIDSLLEWAAPRGVRLQGIQPHHEENSGIGMRAIKSLQKGDVLIAIPSRMMRGLDTISAATRAKLPPKMSIHGLLAAEFILKPPPETWVKVIPTFAEFNSIPFFWSQPAQALLPGTAQRLLKAQQRNFSRDWEKVQSAFPQVSRQDYAHAWFVVSTRAFYQETEETLQYPWLDRLALLPVADLFNHAAIGCKVQYNTDGYDVVADRSYSEGDEVYTSYGEHSNDFLLAEYGFLLQNNTHDRFDPEDLAPPDLSVEDTALLKQMKTIPMLRQVCGPASEEEFIPGFKRSNVTPAGAYDRSQLRKLQSKLLTEAKERRSHVVASSDCTEDQKATLLQRWGQIEELVQKAIRLSTAS
ncbi:hypothetical protein NLG97_g4184 [Lecanicillium saksenae]|uniref:Uncharacterized protein n=1 Tax=Lecanicillium saksenae TaxID=468837 RepID=A0ACC1QYL8_9HYPO|nr:hypothetical protein NLG97_g4184 [Lecanicillium saksenae]